MAFIEGNPSLRGLSEDKGTPIVLHSGKEEERNRIVNQFIPPIDGSNVAKVTILVQGPARQLCRGRLSEGDDDRVRIPIDDTGNLGSRATLTEPCQNHIAPLRATGTYAGAKGSVKCWKVRGSAECISISFSGRATLTLEANIVHDRRIEICQNIYR